MSFSYQCSKIFSFKFLCWLIGSVHNVGKAAAGDCGEEEGEGEPARHGEKAVSPARDHRKEGLDAAELHEADHCQASVRETPFCLSVSASPYRWNKEHECKMRSITCHLGLLA